MMHEESARIWIRDTYLTIKTFLLLFHIPYEDGHRSDELLMAHHYTEQILFPWCGGDVVIGTLHSFDLDRMLKGFSVDEKVDAIFPSIETYGFPWDHGDITVFRSPEKFIKTIVNYYNGVMKKGEHRDE